MGKEMLAVVGISGVLDKSLGKAVDAAQKKISGINPKAVKAAAAVTGIATAAFNAGKKLASVGASYQKAMGQLQASTGASDKEMKRLGDTVQNVYKNNFGESMQEVADCVAEISKTTKTSGKSLQGVTEGAITLRDTLGYDVSESARAAKAMMLNFGIDGEKALSMIAAGSQNGLDYSGELLDSISEYSVQFAKVGLDADQMFNIFQQGADSGAWNIDKVGDAVKEFSIRAIDGSDSTRGAYEKLGLDADKMMQVFAKGGPQANESFNMVLNKLMDMDDEVERDAVGVSLFGTMWEDLGTDAMQALAKAEGKAYDTNDALKTMEETKYGDLQSAMEGIGRIMEVALLPIAAEAARKLTEMSPQIEAAVNAGVKKMKELAPVAKAIFTGIKDNMNMVVPIVVTLASSIGMLKFARLTSEIGGYAKAVKNAAGITKILTKMKLRDKGETIALKAMYAKDAVAKKANTAATKIQAAASRVFSKEKMKERAQIIRTKAVQMKEVAAKKANVAVQKIQTAATAAWSAVSKGAAVATRLLGSAIRFMTGPIGIAIAAIAAIVAAGVLLYKNWDKVKAKAVEIAGKIKGVFGGMKDKIVSVFSAMKDKIGGIMGSLAAIVKKPINAVIGIVNKMIDAVNNLSFDIPDWVPKIGGDTIGFNIPHLKLLEAGGMTEGPSIAGEGRYDEMVITPDPRYRTENIAYWQKAGRMLGMDEPTVSLGNAPSVNVSMGGIEYNPTIEIRGDANEEDVLSALRKSREEFMDMLEEWWEERMEFIYGI